MSIITGFFGLFSTLAALNAFANTCFSSVHSNLDELTVTKTPGAAFILLLVATVLKTVDIWAHLIVPVPESDYWTPNGKLIQDTNKLIEVTEKSSPA
jgi:hypothetical protein